MEGWPGRKGAHGWRGAAILAGLLIPSVLTGQEQVEESRPLRPDGRLSVEAVSHTIHVEAWDRSEVHVTGVVDPASQRLEVSGSESDLAIRVVHEGSARERGTLHVRIPSRARITVGTVSGPVTLDGVAGTVRVSSTSGSVRLTGTPSQVTLNTVSGEVEVDGPVPDLQVNTVSGSAALRGAGGRLEANTVSGRVTLTAGGPLDRIRMNSVSGSLTVEGPLSSNALVELESHSGTIILRIPADTQGEFEVDTFSGGIRNGLTGDEPRSPRFGPGRSLFFRTGNGTARVIVQNFSGNVVLEGR